VCVCVWAGALGQIATKATNEFKLSLSGGSESSVEAKPATAARREG
jgi:hypothetical protein